MTSTTEEPSQSDVVSKESSPDPEAVPCRVLVVDDHAAIREILSVWIENEPGLELFGTAGSLREAEEAIEESRPDAAVIDLSLPDGSGMEFVRRYCSAADGIRGLVYSMHDEELFADLVLKAGGLGYVMKTEASEVVVDAIKTVCRRVVFLSDAMTAMVLRHSLEREQSRPAFPIDSLTSRERAVCDLIIKGLDAEEVASKLDLSLKTVEAYRRQAKEKLGFESIMELHRFLEERAIHSA